MVSLVNNFRKNSPNENFTPPEKGTKISSNFTVIFLKVSYKHFRISVLISKQLQMNRMASPWTNI